MRFSKMSKLKASISKRLPDYFKGPYHWVMKAVLASTAAATLVSIALTGRLVQHIFGIRNSFQLAMVYLAAILTMGLVNAALVIAWHVIMTRFQKQTDAAIESRNQLAGNMSHAMVSPLGEVHHLIEFVKHGIGDKDEQCDKALAAIDSLIALIAKRTQIQQDRDRMEMVAREEFDLALALKDDIARHARIASGRNIALTWLWPAQPIKVLAHPYKLSAIVDNLLDNAVKYNNDGGTVTVKFSAIRTKKRSRLKITVSDTGRGMDENELAHMYDEFYRGGKAKTGPGFGMGLAIVQSTVQFYGGSITCKSAPGKGSTFTLRLPVRLTA